VVEIGKLTDSQNIPDTTNQHLFYTYQVKSMPKPNKTKITKHSWSIPSGNLILEGLRQGQTIEQICNNSSGVLKAPTVYRWIGEPDSGNEKMIAWSNECIILQNSLPARLVDRIMALIDQISGADKETRSNILAEIGAIEKVLQHLDRRYKKLSDSTGPSVAIQIISNIPEPSILDIDSFNK